MSLESYLKAGPKAELHVHLEGSIRSATTLTLAKRNAVALPCATLEELRDWFASVTLRTSSRCTARSAVAALPTTTSWSPTSWLRSCSRRLPLDQAVEEQRASRVQQEVGPVSQGLVDYTGGLLFRDLWLRPDLAPRDRSLVTVSALIAAG